MASQDGTDDEVTERKGACKRITVEKPEHSPTTLRQVSVSVMWDSFESFFFPKNPDISQVFKFPFLNKWLSKQIFSTCNQIILHVHLKNYQSVYPRLSFTSSLSAWSYIPLSPSFSIFVPLRRTEQEKNALREKLKARSVTAAHVVAEQTTEMENEIEDLKMKNSELEAEILTIK